MYCRSNKFSFEPRRKQITTFSRFSLLTFRLQVRPLANCPSHIVPVPVFIIKVDVPRHGGRRTLGVLAELVVKTKTTKFCEKPK